MIPVLIESALRAMVVALTVGAGLRLLRVRNVPAQKAAWGLVLACAVAMPLVIPLATRWQVLPEWLTLRLPVNYLPASSWSSTPAAAPVSDAASLNLSAADVADATPVKSVDVPRRELHRASAGGDRFPRAGDHCEPRQLRRCRRGGDFDCRDAGVSGGSRPLGRDEPA